MTINERQFFSRNFDNSTSKILLIGSSHVGMLDVVELEKIINQDSNQYEIFNLAKGSDSPSKRLKELPQLLLMQPTLVVYGIGYRDFGDTDSSNTENFLPEPDKLIKNLLDIPELDFLNNPKLTTLNVVRNTLGITTFHNTTMTSTPFFQYSEDHSRIMNLNEIELLYKNVNVDFDVPSIENSSELPAIEIMLNEFKNNNIDVIFFITPHNSQYINKLSETDKKHFDEILHYIEKKYDIHFESLLTNYTDLEIWSSPNHVTHSSKGLIYNQDVAEIILKGLM